MSLVSKQEQEQPQEDQIMDQSQQPPTLSTAQFEKLIQAQASHAIVQKLEKQYNKTQMIEIYSAAYRFHSREAGKFKAMLAQLSNSLVPDLDKPDVNMTYDLTEEMKRLLVKKKNEL